jgi:hypothetical protein
MKSKYCAILNVNGVIYFVSKINWDRDRDSNYIHHIILTKSFKSAKKWAVRQNVIDSITYYHTYEKYKKVDIKIGGKILFEDKTDIFNDIFDEAIKYYTKNPKHKTRIGSECSDYTNYYKLLIKKNAIINRKKKCNIKTDVKMEIKFTNERKMKLETLMLNVDDIS